jgi:hypothetical protein
MSNRRKKARRPASDSPSSPPAAVTQPNPAPASSKGNPQSTGGQRGSRSTAAAERRRNARLRKYAFTGIAVAVIGGLAFAYWQRQANKPGESVMQIRSPHISEDDPTPNYSTDPPTSGPHYENVAPWGVSAEPVKKELMVHNLEDGGVVISYRPDIDAATLDQLKAVTGSYPTEVLTAPYPDLSNPIVLTAWRRIDRLDAFDEARIRRFVEAYRGIDHHRESGS